MLDIQKKLTTPFYALLSLPATAMGYALCVQIACLSWILNTQYGFDIHQVGIVWIAGPLAGIIGQVLIGVISDNVWFWNGRRRPFIIIGGTIAALMILALPNIHIIQKAMGVESLIGVAITVALTLDLSINISFNPTRSIIADVTPEGEMRTKGYTWMQTISGFFGVLAYLIGALVSNYFLIYSGAIFVFVASVVPVFFIEEPKELQPESEATEEEPRTTNWPEFLKIGIAHAFSWVGIQIMFVYLFAYIKVVIMGYETTTELPEAEANQIGTTIGIAFAILNTVGFLLPATVLEPLSERIGRVRTQAFCIAIMAIGYLLLVLFGQSTIMLYVFMAIIGIGWGAVVSLPFAIMSETVSQGRMGFFMGIFNLFVVVPQLLASALGGFFEAQADKSIIFVVSALMLGLSAIAWWMVKKDEGKKQTANITAGH